jgi:hypothetical protein
MQIKIITHQEEVTLIDVDQYQTPISKDDFEQQNWHYSAGFMIF